MANTYDRFEQGFEEDSDGISDGGDYGALTIVPSGTGGIIAADGSSFAIVEQTDSGPFTRFDGYRALDTNQGFTTQIKIYLDPASMSAGEGFDFSVAANDQNGNHLRDFVFHVTQDTSTGQLLVGASNNSNFDPIENLEAGNHGVITTAGWYTFEHTFYDAGDDTLAVAMTIKNPEGVAIFTEVLNNPGDIYSTDFGGNRYGWFTNIDVAGGIAIDDVKLLTEDVNPVQVKDGNVIIGTYASVEDAKDALDTGALTATTAEIFTTGADDNFFYVAEGMSIQAAIDASSDGDTIEVGAGTFNESLNVTSEVTLTGAGAGNTILEGPLLASLSVPGGMPLNDYFEENNPAYSASLGVQISADNVAFSGFTITSFSEAMAINTSDGVSVTDNEFIDNVTGLRKGTAQVVTNVTISGNSFSQGVHGVTIYAAPDGSGAFDGVTMDGNSFSALSEKGMYFEQLANASLSDNVFDDVGNFGRISPPFGGTQGEFGQAIDINLKYENYENVVFNDTIITNSGHSDQDGGASPGAFGAAIGVKTRDDAPSYSAQPATFTGSIIFNGGSIDGTSTGFRIGEPGKNNNGPNVLIDGMLILNATESEVDNAASASTGGVVTAALGAAQSEFDGSVSQAALHVTGSANGELIIGGSNDDTLLGGGGDDTLIGGLGADSLGGDGGSDTVSYAASAAGVSVNMSTGAASGGSATGDALTSIENAIGSAFDDTLIGTGGANFFLGGAGADIISGGGGNDTASYEGSSAGVTIDLALAIASGGDATGDTLTGIEHVIGSSHNDILLGNSLSNNIVGGDGDDILFGGAGADTLAGGAGVDSTSYATSGAGVIVDLLSGVGSGGDAQGDVLSSIEEVTGTAFDDKIIGDGSDNLFIGNAGDDTILGNGGEDSIFAGFGDDRVEGGDGDDLVSAGPGKDTLIGGEGNDTLGASNKADLLRGEGGADLMLGSNGNDRLFGGDGDDTMLGGNGRDMLSGDAGADRLVGGAGVDTASYSSSADGVWVRLWAGDGLAGEALGDVLIEIENLVGSVYGDTLIGDDGANRIDGGAGADIIMGLDGNDQLIGGAGDDTITGGAGDDTFIFFAVAGGADVISDFVAGASSDDVIRLYGFGPDFDTFAEVTAAATQVGADTIIDFGGGASITLASVNLASLDADDFLFG